MGSGNFPHNTGCAAAHGIHGNQKPTAKQVKRTKAKHPPSLPFFLSKIKSANAGNRNRLITKPSEF
jgi:hypothetical protein